MFCLKRVSFAALPPAVGNPNWARTELSLAFSIVAISPGVVGYLSIGVLFEGFISGSSRSVDVVRREF